MNLHEYQGKEILSQHGVRVQRGYVAEKVSEAVSKGKQLLTEIVRKNCAKICIWFLWKFNHIM